MNNLVWKLLRKHISIPQFLGFSFANLFGMLVVMLGMQFYKDVMSVFSSEDSFLKADYLIVNKKIGTSSTFSGQSNSFSDADIDDLSAQAFARSVAKFSTAEYKVNADMGINGVNVLNSDISIESVPDKYVDAKTSGWHWQEGDRSVPIILPRAYIAMYNFGFAQSHSLPKLSDGLAGMIDMKMFLQGNDKKTEVEGRVVGFSSRLNTILVPQSFMDWSNKTFAPQNHSEPTRLIVDTDNPLNEKIGKYMDKMGYEIEDDKVNEEKTTYFLKVLVVMVTAVGLIISALSFYLLMLSIYLLVQKNSEKLENLLLIGYSPSKTAQPYQLLTIVLNFIVLVLACIILFVVRKYYMEVLETLFPQIDDGGMYYGLMVGLALFLLVSLCNVFVIHRKVLRIWYRKD